MDNQFACHNSHVVLDYLKKTVICKTERMYCLFFSIAVGRYLLSGMNNNNLRDKNGNR